MKEKQLEKGEVKTRPVADRISSLQPLGTRTFTVVLYVYKR